ncbi:MAG: hypothetical protein ABW360_06740 [Phenylobacterium sp.]
MSALEETLRQLAPGLAQMRDDWWLIGSAAMALAGAEGLTVADVDLLASAADARRLAALWGVTPAPPAPNPLFRSEIYFQWMEPPLPVDVMAGFQVRGPDGWRPLRPVSRVAAGGVFIPSVAEQIDILGLFDRPKDRERAVALRALV